MNKKLINLAIMGALVSPFAVQASGDVKVNGFADVILSVANDVNADAVPQTASEKVFTANGEIDVTGGSENVTVRADIDLSIKTDTDATVDGPTDSGQIEQAFFAWNLMDKATLIGGVFNNPIGLEKEDAPDLYQISHGQIYDILNGQTSLYGNNLAGVALAIPAGPATVTLAVVDDLGLALDEFSTAVVVNSSVPGVEGLDVEIGFVSQDGEQDLTAAPADQALGRAGNVTDVNVSYSTMGATFSLEFLQAAAIVDSAVGFTANYMSDANIGGTVRYDQMTPEASGVDDVTSTTVALIWEADKNLSILLENKSIDDGTDTNSETGIEFLASF